MSSTPWSPRRPATGEIFPLGPYTVVCVPVIALALWIGWRRVRGNAPANEFYS